MSNDTIIRVENLSKCFHIYDKPHHRLMQGFFKSRKQFFKEFWAVKSVSFEMKKGEIYAIVGRNGSGKSTLLQMICGTLTPTGGNIETNGRIAALLELGSGFNPDFTGRENVLMNAAVLGLSKEEIDACYDSIVAFADIGDFIEQPVKTYSSGMMMRLAFAVSIGVSPDILVIDEALAVGDAAFQFKCMERMQSLAKSGTTMLFVSHDMGMIKSFCNQAIYLEKGVIKLQGQPDEVAEHYFFDIRNEQRRHLNDKVKLIQKDSLHNKDMLAFGTEQGRITSAYFLPDKTNADVFGHGEPIRFRVEAEYDTELSGVSMSVVLTDSRMLAIAGKYFLLKAESEKNGKSLASIEAEFVTTFAPGTYFLTLRLENRVAGNNFLPIDKQVGALSFEVTPFDSDFLGTVDIGIKQIQNLPTASTTVIAEKKRVVALIAVRNEALYLPRCLDHLYQQGVDVCIIDNESTDGSLEIVRQYMNNRKGVFRIEKQPYKGYFDLVEQLQIKERLVQEIQADWFIHQDADEILESPDGEMTLQEAFTLIDSKGYNMINFEEFVFLPADDEPSFEEQDYVAMMKNYYFFAPSELRLQRAWKKNQKISNFASFGGHRIEFEDKNIYPENFRLRHYITLSREHLQRKYGYERIYNKKEVEELQWHGERAHFNSQKARLPCKEELCNLDSDGWSKSTPIKKHLFFGS